MVKSLTPVLFYFPELRLCVIRKVMKSSIWDHLSEWREHLLERRYGL